MIFGVCNFLRFKIKKAKLDGLFEITGNFTYNE